MDLTTRIDSPELMDTQVFPVDMMRETLDFLRVTNQYFGGIDVVLRHFKTWSRAWTPGETIRVLDVGAGGGEIAVALAQWSRAAGFKMEIIGIDLVEEVAQVARENAEKFPEIEIQTKNVFEMGESFEYVIASLLFHHIPPSESVRLLKHLDGLASRGILISDLYRSTASYTVVTALSYLIGNAIVRHDGPLSVRRAFRVEELSALSKEAGLDYLCARREPWFRVSLAGEK